MHERIQIGPYTTSRIELRDLLKAWVVIAGVFTLLRGGLSFDSETPIIFLISALTVGVGFLLHELAHKIVAQYFGCFAEFRANNSMLVLGILMALTGFVFLAPGAVVFSGPVGVKRVGKIAAAGPITNYILAILFLFIAKITSGIPQIIGEYGFTINVWLGLFNMIPAWMFDGKKIITWDKRVFAGMVVVGFALLFVSF